MGSSRVAAQLVAFPVVLSAIDLFSSDGRGQLVSSFWEYNIHFCFIIWEEIIWLGVGYCYWWWSKLSKRIKSYWKDEILPHFCTFVSPVKLQFSVLFSHRGRNAQVADISVIHCSWARVIYTRITYDYVTMNWTLGWKQHGIFSEHPMKNFLFMGSGVMWNPWQ